MGHLVKLGGKAAHKPLISVIMLTYNRERMVGRAIESILTQTMPFFELIIVNNGSTDKSREVCAKYAQLDSRVRLIEKKYGNIGSGRNSGISLATGEYITFVDDDDISYPKLLEFLYSLATDHQADISFCGSDKEVDGVVLSNYVFDDLRFFSPEQVIIELFERKILNAASPTKLWARRIFDSILFPETGKYDDISTIYKFFASANKIVGQGVPQYCFLRHLGNNSAFTGNDRLLEPNQLEEYFAAYRERTQYICKRFPSIKNYIIYSEWSFLLSMYNKIQKNDLRHCKKQLKYIESVLLPNLNIFYNGKHIKDFEKQYVEMYFLSQNYTDNKSDIG